MRNGSISNKLVLVNSSGQPLSGQEADSDSAVDYRYDAQSETSAPGDGPQSARNALLVFMAVSIACTAAAIATGSYAVWLGRRQAAQQAITDVNDLLKTCQTRMRQLETDVQNLPSRAQ